VISAVCFVEKGQGRDIHPLPTHFFTLLLNAGRQYRRQSEL
jgi:hypothetical protein